MSTMLIPYKLLCLILLIHFVHLGKTSPTNTCMNPKDVEVDWNIIYLLPGKQPGATNLKFLYIDDTMDNFEVLDVNPNDFPPLIAATDLNSETDTYIIWNDDATNGTDKPVYDDHFGHTKGVLVFNQEKGMYIIHSLPRFPFHDNDGKIISELPSNAGYYGQTFFCMSINFSEIPNILQSLSVIKPHVLLHNISDEFGPDTAINKLIEDLAQERFINTSLQRQIDISTIKGKKINLFLKDKNMELPWDTAIPNFYEDSFFVETWTKPALLPNICTTDRSVFNMKTMNFLDHQLLDTEDHSKWGVSVKKNIVCYGDLNRTQSQKKRCGSIACFEDTEIAKLVKGFIEDYEHCSNKELHFLE